MCKSQSIKKLINSKNIIVFQKMGKNFIILNNLNYFKVNMVDLENEDQMDQFLDMIKKK